ncbi:pentapeptide repeat-containing protein [Streptomyces sp. NPDC059552]|uniref:pentapeptide repeat-containing protein n=1 Tax=Streptomyces sp. NPDC059552 TaxID=3346862 RepID=UPI0036ADF131
MSTPPSLIPAPSWPYCGQGADASEPHGCRGRRVRHYAECFAHLADADRNAYLTSLGPGDAIDHRGTSFTAALLTSLLDALGDPSARVPCLGTALFESAQFSENVNFNSVRFDGFATFNKAHFEENVRFVDCRFATFVHFGEARFSGHAAFADSQFSEVVSFDNA